MTWKVITPPSEEPVTILQAKQHVRIEWPDDDNYMADLISMARDILEQKIGRALMTQTLQAVSHLAEITQAPLSGVIVGSNGTEAMSYAIEIPQPPLISVTSVEIETQVSQWSLLTVTDDYIVDTDALIGKVYLATSALAKWAVSLNYPGTRPRVRITYQAGYGSSPSNVPFAIRRNISEIAAWLYENRGISDVPEALISSTYQVMRLY